MGIGISPPPKHLLIDELSDDKTAPEVEQTEQSSFLQEETEIAVIGGLVGVSAEEANGVEANGVEANGDIYVNGADKRKPKKSKCKYQVFVAERNVKFYLFLMSNLNKTWDVLFPPTGGLINKRCVIVLPEIQSMDGGLLLKFRELVRTGMNHFLFVSEEAKYILQKSQRRRH